MAFSDHLNKQSRYSACMQEFLEAEMVKVMSASPVFTEFEEQRKV